MSSTNKTANYQLSQFVGTDIPSILNDYNGDMRKIDSAIKDASVAGGDNATAIAELQTSTARMNTEIGGINSTVNTLSGKIVGIEEVIPATASAQNKLLTAQELPEIPSITELEEEVSDISGDVKAIQLCVPATASESNKLATMDDIGSGYVLVFDEDLNDIRTDSTLQGKWNAFLNAHAQKIVDGRENLIANMGDGEYSYDPVKFNIILTGSSNIGVNITSVGSSFIESFNIQTANFSNARFQRMNFDTNGITITDDMWANIRHLRLLVSSN